MWPQIKYFKMPTPRQNINLRCLFKTQITLTAAGAVDRKTIDQNNRLKKNIA